MENLPLPTMGSNNYMLNNLMEVISNDRNNRQAHTTARNDHLRPILDYLRQDDEDGNSILEARTSVIVNSSNARPGGYKEIIDLTNDDEPEPLPARIVRNPSAVIDLTDSPPSVPRQQEQPSPFMNPGQNQSSVGAGTCVGGARDNFKPKIEPSACGSAQCSRGTATDESKLWLICPVCLDTFEMIKEENKRQLISTPCGHVFCSSCIQDIMQNHKRCPTCRKPIKKVSLRLIFL